MNRTETTQTILQTILAHYPTAQAIYLFGSYAAQRERPDSDIDIAVLLPPALAAEAKNLNWSVCQVALATALRRAVDLVNVRLVSTVFQKEIIVGERVYCADEYAADEFEMLTISYYQKLNEERRGILAAFYETGKAYPV